MGKCLPNWNFFQCCFVSFHMYYHLRTLFASLQFFFHDVYPFVLSVMFLLFPYFSPKLIFLLCIRLLVWARTFSIGLWVEISFVTLKSPFFDIF